MKRVAFFILAIASGLQFWAQTNETQDNLSAPVPMRTKRNTVFVELLGNAGIGGYSINYDYILPVRDFGGISFRAGGTYNTGFLAFPVLANIVTGEKNHHFEMGAGCTFYRAWNTIPSGYAAPTGCLSYRYQKPGGGFFFKIGYTPVFYKIDPSDRWDFRVLYRYWPGLGIGGTF